jgi:hypothetical protein
MILPDLKLKFTANKQLKSYGIDSYQHCSNKEHFLNYPYSIEYQFNSRGFRGPEWPSNLDETCWCIGDSFTLGMGSPYNHTWAYILQETIKIKTINVSMVGASNDWMARKTCEILEIKPKYIVVQWSYVHRREFSTGKYDESRRIHNIPDNTTEQDIQNNIDCINLVESNNKNTTIIHTFIPKNVPEGHELSFKELIDKMNINVVWFDQIDYARDYLHYDIKTSTSLAEKIAQSKYINI